MVDERRPTKHEVELETIRAKHEFRLRIVDGAIIVACVLSFGLPLYFVYKTIAALAGTQTTVSPHLATLVAAMVGGGSALAMIGTGVVKLRSQRKELVRLRSRCEELEKLCTQLRQELNAKGPRR